jgi:hypothetical protein
MTEIIRMARIEPVIFGVLKIEWLDGFVGIVDIRPVIGDGEMFAFLRRDQRRFLAVRLEEFGHKIFWLDDDGDEIDFGSASLRHRAERQAEILRLAS